MFAPLLTLVVVVQLDAAWKDADAVYLSYDVDSIEAAFVPGTGWPEPGGLLPREALKIVGMVAAEGLCGMELVEVSPPYDVSDITALMGLRLIVDVMGALPLPVTLPPRYSAAGRGLRSVACGWQGAWSPTGRWARTNPSSTRSSHLFSRP